MHVSSSSYDMALLQGQREGKRLRTIFKIFVTDLNDKIIIFKLMMKLVDVGTTHSVKEQSIQKRPTNTSGQRRRAACKLGGVSGTLVQQRTGAHTVKQVDDRGSNLLSRPLYDRGGGRTKGTGGGEYTLVLSPRGCAHTDAAGVGDSPRGAGGAAEVGRRDGAAPCCHPGG